MSCTDINNKGINSPSSSLVSKNPTRVNPFLSSNQNPGIGCSRKRTLAGSLKQLYKNKTHE